MQAFFFFLFNCICHDLTDTLTFGVCFTRLFISVFWSFILQCKCCPANYGANYAFQRQMVLFVCGHWHFRFSFPSFGFMCSVDSWCLVGTSLFWWILGAYAGRSKENEELIHAGFFIFCKNYDLSSNWCFFYTDAASLLFDNCSASSSRHFGNWLYNISAVLQTTKLIMLYTEADTFICVRLLAFQIQFSFILSRTFSWCMMQILDVDTNNHTFKMQ